MGGVDNSCSAPTCLPHAAGRLCYLIEHHAPCCFDQPPSTAGPSTVAKGWEHALRQRHPELAGQHLGARLPWSGATYPLEFVATTFPASAAPALVWWPAGERFAPPGSAEPPLLSGELLRADAAAGQLFLRRLQRSGYVLLQPPAALASQVHPPAT